MSQAMQSELQAIRAQASADPTRALALARAFVERYPDNAQGHFLLGQLYARSGDTDAALAALMRAEQLGPRNPLPALGQMALLRDAGRFAQAHACLDRALALAPDLPDRDSQRASIWQSEGRLEQALAALAQEIARLGPAANARLLNNYGQCARQLGDFVTAQTALGQAIDRDPDYALAYRNLGDLQFYSGQMQGAEAVYRTMTERMDVQDPEVWRRWGHALNAIGDTDAAERAWSRALALGDTERMTAHSLLFQLKRRNACLAAVDLARRIIAQDPTDAAAHVAEALSLPAVYESREAVTEWRRRYRAGLDRLASLAVDGLATNTLANLSWSNFHLAYQGEDDAALQAQWADILQRWLGHAAPEFMQPLAMSTGQGRIRIGFWSSFLRDCTVGKYFASWITDLPREHFEVTVFHASFVEDDWVNKMRAAVDRHIRVAGAPMVHARTIRDQALDILVYPEVGMDAASPVLSCLRLAPLQIALWGHPVTTGSTQIDHYVSVAAMEPADYADHYRERVLCLPGLGTRYTQPTLADSAPGRRTLGLPEDAVLLLVPQSAFKIHPDNDALIAAILSARPQSHLVLFEDAARGNSEALDARWAPVMQRAGVDWRARRTWLDRRDHAGFLAVNRACDLMLDTLHWSGGNTSLDAIAMGLPIVTLPGRFMRGRQSMGMLRLLDLTETIAHDPASYVALTLRLIDDAPWRAQLRTALKARAHRLFDDPAPVRMWVEWLRERTPRS